MQSVVEAPVVVSCLTLVGWGKGRARSRVCAGSLGVWCAVRLPHSARGSPADRLLRRC